MTVDRNRMAELHEAFLAEVFGGRVSKASGATWQDPGDGRDNRLVEEEYAFAWDGKSTRGKGIDVTRAMIDKIREDAGGERPALGLRYYDTDDLQEIGEDWILISAIDFREMLTDARTKAADFAELLEAARAAAQAEAAAEDLQRFAPPVMPMTTPIPMPPPSLLHGIYPPDLPPPVPEMWPCLVVDSRHGEAEGGRLVSHGYYVDESGMVTGSAVNSARIEQSVAAEPKLFVNDVIVRRGMLYVDGVLRVTVGRPRT